MPTGTPQTYNLSPQRIGKFKGQILKHAVMKEVLARQGRNVKYMPKNSGDTYVSRRWLPYGSTTTNPNVFFPTADGDRGNVIVNAHLTVEGVTPPPDSITPQDIQTVINEYSCLYAFTNKTYDMYEDDIPKEMIKQVGERTSLVNEMILWGILRSCTNQFYGGTGTTMATVDGPLTLGMIRKMVKGLQANHAEPVNAMLKASGDYGTSPVSSGYAFYGHTDLEPDVRELPGFIPVEKYASGKPMEHEIGTVERIRFFTSPDLPSFQNAGAAIGSTDLFSTTGVNIDVYPFILMGQDAWSQVAVRGLDNVDPTYLAPGLKTKSDPHGQRGYCGNLWHKAAQVENHGWMAVGNVGVKNLN